MTVPTDDELMAIPDYEHDDPAADEEELMGLLNDPSNCEFTYIREKDRRYRPSGRG
jgi:hypothetical protein